MWRVPLSERDNALRVREEQLRRLDAAKSRHEIISILESTPSLRRECDVGPVEGIDWSILTSRVQVGDMRGVSNLGAHPLVHLRNVYSVKIPTNPDRDYYVAYHGYSRHKCVDFTRLTEEGVIAWSQYAKRNGVRYSKNGGYVFPTAKSAVKWRKVDFKSAKERGLVPVAKRSPEASLRRAHRRRLGLKDPLRTAAKAAPVYYPEPVLVRASRSSRELRSSWWRSGRKVRWSEYRLAQVIEPVLVLAARPCHRGGLSQPVVAAISRIYSREVRVPRTPFPVRESFTVVKKPLVFEPKETRHDAVVRLLKSIEDKGFPQGETIRWFALNHELQKLRDKIT